jgi:hypothetical protein
MNKMEFDHHKDNDNIDGNVFINHNKNEFSKNIEKQSKREKNDEIELKSIKDISINDGTLNYVEHDDNNNRRLPSLEISEENDYDSQIPEKFLVPPNLKKTFLCSMFLFFIGLTLFILGFIQDVAAADPGKGITFWVLGSIVMIPGGYYSYQFYKAKKARSLDERDEILDQIPEL